jgi:hypothetical protein
LCFEGVFVPGPREVTEVFWNACCAAAVATGLTGAVHQLKEAMDQFQQKCLMSLSKNRSGVPFLRTDMPRVLIPRESDTTSAVKKEEAFAMIQRTMEEIMTKHNTAFLNSFRQMMVDVFGPSVDKHFEQGESSTAVNG